MQKDARMLERKQDGGLLQAIKPAATFKNIHWTLGIHRFKRNRRHGFSAPHHKF